MELVRVVVRILIGLLFVLAGVVTFLVAPPPQPGLAGAVNEALKIHVPMTTMRRAAQFGRNAGIA